MDTEQWLDREERDAASQVLRALAHPIRLGVLQCLSACDSMTVSELQDALGCGQSMMSQQLRRLEQQGLISTRKVGTTKQCSIRNRDFLKLFSCLRNHLRVVLGGGGRFEARAFSE